MANLVSNVYEPNKDSNGFIQFFLEVIEEEAYKVEQDETIAMSYYKVYGKTRMGYPSTMIGYGNDETINMDDIIISGKSIYSVWIKLYKYCYSISKETAYKYLLQPFENEWQLYSEKDADITIMIDNFLKTFWDKSRIKDGKVQLIKVLMI